MARTIDENALLTAALGEFAEKPYDQASVNEIIQRADISKGSFYYRYKDKYELYSSVLKQARERKMEYLRRNDRDGHADFFEWLEKRLTSAFVFAAEHPLLHALSQRFTSETDERLREKVLGEIKDHDGDELSARIRSALANQEFCTEFTEDFILRCIAGTFLNFDRIFFTREMVTLEEIRETSAQLVLFLKRGLGKV